MYEYVRTTDGRTCMACLSRHSCCVTCQSCCKGRLVVCYLLVARCPSSFVRQPAVRPAMPVTPAWPFVIAFSRRAYVLPRSLAPSTLRAYVVPLLFSGCWPGRKREIACQSCKLFSPSRTYLPIGGKSGKCSPQIVFGMRATMIWMECIRFKSSQRLNVSSTCM